MTEKQITTNRKRPLQLTRDNSARVRVTRSLMRLIGKVLFTWTTVRLHVHGLENVPRSGPTILLFNHLTLLDPPLVGLPVTFRDPIPIGKEELSHNLITGPLAWMWDTIPIKRGELDMTALRRSLFVLESRDLLMIAPEGHRNDSLRAPKEGFVMLAARSNAVIVPAGISGTENYKANLRRLRRSPITVRYGAPFRLKGKISRTQYMEAAHESMYQIARLITPNLRGDYASLDKATMNLIEPA